MAVNRHRGGNGPSGLSGINDIPLGRKDSTGFRIYYLSRCRNHRCVTDKERAVRTDGNISFPVHRWNIELAEVIQQFQHKSGVSRSAT